MESSQTILDILIQMQQQMEALGVDAMPEGRVTWALNDAHNAIWTAIRKVAETQGEEKLAEVQDAWRAWVRSKEVES